MRFISKAQPEPKSGWPALDERAKAAVATAAAALSIFETVASDLEAAAAEHADVAFEANAEIDRLLDIQCASQDAADEAVAQARRIRELVAA